MNSLLGPLLVLLVPLLVSASSLQNVKRKLEDPIYGMWLCQQFYDLSYENEFDFFMDTFDLLEDIYDNESGCEYDDDDAWVWCEFMESSVVDSGSYEALCDDADGEISYFNARFESDYGVEIYNGIPLCLEATCPVAVELETSQYLLEEEFEGEYAIDLYEDEGSDYDLADELGSENCAIDYSYLLWEMAPFGPMEDPTVSEDCALTEDITWCIFDDEKIDDQEEMCLENDGTFYLNKLLASDCTVGDVGIRSIPTCMPLSCNKDDYNDFFSSSVYQDTFSSISCEYTISEEDFVDMDPFAPIHSSKKSKSKSEYYYPTAPKSAKDTKESKSAYYYSKAHKSTKESKSEYYYSKSSKSAKDIKEPKSAYYYSKAHKSKSKSHKSAKM